MNKLLLQLISFMFLMMLLGVPPWPGKETP